MSYFDRFESAKSEVIILLISSLILNFGFGILIPFIPLYAQDLGATVTLVGVIIAGFTAGRAVMAGLAGAYSDRVGRKRVMITGTLLYAITTGGMAFAPSWQWLLIMRVFEGFAVGIVYPVSQAYLIDVVPKNRVGEANGLYSMTFSAGFFVGPLLGSSTFYIVTKLGGTDFQGLQATFLLTGTLAILSLIVIIFKIKDIPPVAPAKEELNYRKALETFEGPVENPQGEYIKYYMMTFLNGIGIGAIIPIFTIYFNEVQGFNEEIIGLVLGISGGISAVIAGPAGVWGDRIGRKRPMLFGIPIMVISTGLLGFASTIIMAATFFWIRAFAQSFFITNFRALQSDVALAFERGKVFGRTQTWFNIGAVGGPIVGSYLYEIMIGKTYDFFGFTFFGEATPFLITALFQGFMIFILLTFKFPEAGFRHSNV